MCLDDLNYCSMAASKKRKLWSFEAMSEAVECVASGKGLREASRLYNVPVETLRRRVNGTVQLECRPGPSTVLSAEEEGRVVEYLINMADIGYGLTREMVLRLVSLLVNQTGSTHW